MAYGYTDVPHNLSEVLPYVIIDSERSVVEIFRKDKCYFYDTCSFRRHANLSREAVLTFLEYIKEQNGLIIITRTILMELASYSGVLNQEYLTYIRYMGEAGVCVLVMYEEDLFSVMDVCFSTNRAINNYLSWAVRMMRRPISTITEVLEENGRLNDEVIKAKNLDRGDIYKRFFQAVRAKKEAQDNLGEEILAICLYILSQIPGEEDGKFCVFTDDKGAGGKIYEMFQDTPKQYRGKDVIIFSTPKFVQTLYREKVLEERDKIREILKCGTDGKLTILGMLIYDIRNREISLEIDELVELIMQPNGIQIAF